jgi:hypothetical protein
MKGVSIAAQSRALPRAFKTFKESSKHFLKCQSSCGIEYLNSWNNRTMEMLPSRYLNCIQLLKSQEMSIRRGEAPIRGGRGGSPLARAPSENYGVEYLNSCKRRQDGDIPKHASNF